MAKLRNDRIPGAACMLAVLVSLAGVSACIERKETPELGGASFYAGAPPAPQDYAEPVAPVMPQGPAQGQGPVVPAQNGQASPPPVTSTGGQDPADSAAPGADMGAAGAGAEPATDTGGDMLPGVDGPPASGTDEPAVDTPTSTAAPGTLTLNFTSVAAGGRYAPRNVGAVWIETGSGQFVKTLERWAGVRANHLYDWNRASGGWSSFFGIGATPDELDAVTAATMRNHTSHQLTWDMVDNDGQVVPDGTYKVFIEVSDSNSSSKSASAEFQKGPMPAQLNPADKVPYTGLSISYQP